MARLMELPSKQALNDNLESESIAGYQLLEVIGKGGFGVVYRARQSSTSQLVAVKILFLDSINDKQHHVLQLQRFEREISLCAELRHPNIVTLLDKGISNNNHVYAVFEYVPGVTLAQHLSKNGSLSAIDTWQLMSQVLDGLASAHQMGIVHRDLKPQNIMVTVGTTKNRVKILDFGIGAILPKVRKHDYRSLTLANDFIGTPAYSAPEQLRGEQTGTETDLYAWGLVFLECLTGGPVIQGNSAAEVYHKQLDAREVTLPTAILQHPLAVIIRRVLKKKKIERSSDAKNLWHEINNLNLVEIVGTVNTPNIDNHAVNVATRVNQGAFKEKRNITVLSCRVSVIPEQQALAFNDNDLESVELIQQSKLNQCIDIGTRYGGELVGKLGDRILIYFGYHDTHDGGTRGAAHAALEIMNAMKVQTTPSVASIAYHIHTRIGLHTGLMIVNRDELPSGQAAVIAMRLENEAAINSIVVSSECVKCLDRIINFGDDLHCHLSGEFMTLQSRVMLGLKDIHYSNLSPLLKSSRDIIGRQQQLNCFNKHYLNLGSDKASNIFVQGDTGIGKSRFIREILMQSSHFNFQFDVCRCTPEHQNNGLYPFLELILHKLKIVKSTSAKDAVSKLEAELTQVGCNVQQLLPIFCSWLFLPCDVAIDSSLSPQRQKARLMQVIVDWLKYLSSKKDFVLVIEDCHWSDATSFELIQNLLVQAKSVRLQIILTSRIRLQGFLDKNIKYLKLEKLNITETQILIRKCAIRKKLHPSIINMIVENTDGIPLYIEELTRMLLDNYLEYYRGFWNLKKDIITTNIPMGLRDLLITQLERLNCSQDTVQLAATIGREFDYSLLLKTSNKNSHDLDNDICELISAEIIYPINTNGNKKYAFRHALIRDAAYQLMLDEIRQQRHDEIASSLHLNFNDRIVSNPGEVAHHFSLANNPKQSSHFFLTAAKLSENNYSNSEAINYYQRALAEIKNITAVNWSESSLKRQHNWHKIISEANEALADCLMVQGEQPQVRCALEIALNHSFISDSKTRARILRKIAKSWEYSHDHRKSLYFYQQSENSLGSLNTVFNNPELFQEWLKINSGKIYVNYWDNNTVELKKILAEMKPIVSKIGNQKQQAALIQDELLVNFRQTRYQVNSNTVQRAFELVRLAEKIACKQLLAQANHEYGFSLLYNNKYLSALKIMKRAIFLSEQIDDAVLRCRNLTYLVVAYRMLGNTKQVEYFANIALEQAQHVAMDDYIAAAKSNLAWVAWRKKCYREAKTLAKQAENHWCQLDNHYPYPFQWLGLLLLIALELDNRTKIIKTSILSKYVDVLTNNNQQILPQKINYFLLEYQKNSEFNVLYLKQAIVIAQEQGFL